jgi:hypothetical protein
VTFSPDTVMSQLVGFIDLDTDQNPATGGSPHANSLLGVNQDIGADYFLLLYPSLLLRRVYVLDATSQVLGTVFASVSGKTLQFTIPLSMISDDGTMNIGMVMGSQAPNDAAPNSGHGTITGLGPCPATVAVSDILDGSLILDTLHRFRDEVMIRNAATKQYVDLYYKHAREMSAIMLNTPWLRLRVAYLLWRQRSTVLALLLHQPATMQEADAREIDDLIGVFLERAGPALSNDLKTIRQAVRDRSLLTLFGARVSG